MFLVVQYAEEDVIDDDANKKMTSPGEECRLNEEIANNGPSARDALV